MVLETRDGKILTLLQVILKVKNLVSVVLTATLIHINDVRLMKLEKLSIPCLTNTVSLHQGEEIFMLSSSFILVCDNV